ncbi:hypothetical protein ACLMAJ_01385 [Nocardia sp. KC 131]|uniref:hypothetical protein n=1 Tax=Nocardia arseniciresistens TaxID=3392119 RepID=UPI00398E6CE1
MSTEQDRNQQETSEDTVSQGYSTTDADETTDSVADRAADQPEHNGRGASPDGDPAAPLFAQADIEQLRTRWRELQVNFVDSPQETVTQADELVLTTIQQLTATYAERKKMLEDRWSRFEDGNTEDLRQALRGYRTFFNQLLSTGS